MFFNIMKSLSHILRGLSIGCWGLHQVYGQLSMDVFDIIRFIHDTVVRVHQGKNAPAGIKKRLLNKINNRPA